VEEGTFQEASRDADVLDLSGVVRITSSSCTSPGVAAMKSCASLELHGTGTILSPDESHIGRLINEFRCSFCSHVFEEHAGGPDSGIAPGTLGETTPTIRTSQNVAQRNRAEKSPREIGQCRNLLSPVRHRRVRT